MSNEIEGAVRTMTSRNVRQTDVALAPASDQRAPDMVGSSGSLAELDERQMPPGVVVQRAYRAEKR